MPRRTPSATGHRLSVACHSTLRDRRRRGGFALLITITLLAFLVLLLVSLASLTRVETQVAGNNRHVALARQNALLALSLPTGQLQSLAGPDQRATATAELGGGATDGTRAWTGVWGNSRSSDDYRSEPALLGWLVSGNEANTFATETAASEFGRVATPSTPTRKPDDAVVLGDAVSVGALTEQVRISGAAARLLVGPGSVENTADYVAAPLVNIETPAASVPGLGGSGQVTVGRYAWWAGDEGVKARLNLVDPWATTAATAKERFNRLLVAQRSGIDLVTLDGSATIGASRYNVEGADPARGQFLDALGRTLSFRQSRMLPGFDAANMQTALRRRQHDLTFVSRGVLADSLRGGLRRDLTVLLDTPPASWTGDIATSLDEASVTYAGARRVTDFQSTRLHGADYSMSPSTGADTRSPAAATWEQVSDFYRRSSTNTGVVDVSPRTNNQMGISPIIQRWGVAFDVSATAGGTGTLHLFPHVVLWNPYNTDLRGSYRVRFEFAGTSNDNSTSKRLYFLTPRREPDGTPITENPYTVYHQELFADDRTGTGRYGDRTLEFTIPAVTIPAGQAYVFTPGSTAAYQASGNNALVNAYVANASFTRPLPHTFTAQEVEDTALAFANISGGNGGTMTFHLLDAAGNALQLIDAPGLNNDYVHVDRNNGTATQATILPTGDAINEFRDLSAGPVSPRNHVGFAFLNSLQRSTPRYNWLAHVNQRAPSLGRAGFEWSAGFSSVANWGSVTPRADRSTWTIDVVPGSTGRTYTGPNHGPTFVTADSASVLTQAILFHLPRADTPVLSLGQLQHAALTATPSGHEPTYPFGNAYATPHIRQDRLLRPNTKTPAATGVGSGSEAHLADVSYLLNRALWDRFFFSGTPDEPASTLQARIAAAEPLPNGRLRYLGEPAADAVRHFDRAAANLLVEGAFNVNSASVEAWTALFASMKGVKVNPANGAAASTMGSAPYVRTPYAPAGSGTGTSADQWAGYRTLTDAQVRRLATAMRGEVLARGPFLSLSDFVNRSLAAYPDDTGLRGALQAAIDKASLAGSDNNRTILQRDRPTIASGSVPSSDAEVWEQDGEDYYLQAILAPRLALSPNTGRAKAAMAPGFLTQADMLQALGPALAARSDTFTVRTYGETINPLLDASDPARITGRAWCEAVVQRLPDYVDTTDAADVRPVTGNTVNLTPDNQRFGRRFQIVSFRWLTPSDI